MNPLRPADLVLDHSVQVDSYGLLRSFEDNVDISITSTPSPATQTIDCDLEGGLTWLEVTVKDLQGNEDTIGASFESAVFAVYLRSLGVEETITYRPGQPGDPSLSMTRGGSGEVAMRWLATLFFVLALGVMGCSETFGTGGDGGGGGDGEQPCQSPLSEYCEGSDCPTWDQAIAEAEELGRPRCDGFVDAYSGPCGDLKYIFIGNLAGTIEYFDASGALVVAERYDDVPTFCDETSFNIWYGPIPDCERDPRNTWENFCKGSGYEYCSSVSECGALSESECLSRYNNLQCWARWDSYVKCIGEGGACGSCATDYLREWEVCDQEN